MEKERLRREAMRNLNGLMAAFVCVFSFGWLYYALSQPKPIASATELAVLALAACVASAAMLVLSFHLAMSIFAITVLADSAAVLRPREE
ncbi:hypothetical protein HK414_04875 [Ramlibacter terrae]|uniref:Uncharacterized protein n=1 Tax=Ramlibacter terrae TaxID=2732511 RepID=A0ABX6P0Q6_9BURK|nr:hypothetical protein HK414_04875 [Ramlibacter terrae]